VLEISVCRRNPVTIRAASWRMVSDSPKRHN